MKNKHFLILSSIMISFLFISGCTRYILIDDNEPYAELYYHNITTPVVLTINGDFQKLLTFTDVGEVNYVYTDNISDNFTIRKSGDYFVAASFSTKIGNDDVLLDTCVFINNVEQEHLHLQRTFKVNNDVYAGSMTGIIRVYEGDVVDIRTRAENGGGGNVTATALYGNFNIHYLGDSFIASQNCYRGICE